MKSEIDGVTQVYVIHFVDLNLKGPSHLFNLYDAQGPLHKYQAQ